MKLEITRMIPEFENWKGSKNSRSGSGYTTNLLLHHGDYDRIKIRVHSRNRASITRSEENDILQRISLYKNFKKVLTRLSLT